MKDNKLLVGLVIVFFVIFLFVCGVAVYQEIKLENDITSKEKNNHEENNDNERGYDYKVYDVKDSLVLELIAPVNIIPMLDDADLLPVLYSGNKTVNIDDLPDEQKLYLSLRYYMNSNDISVDACGEGQTKLVKIEDLKNSYVMNDDYLNNLEKSIEETLVGEYTYTLVDDGLDVCFSIFGFEGPLRLGTDMEVVSAYRENDKMYINTKFIRYKLVEGKERNPDNFYYETYDVYSDDAKMIESFEEGLDGSNFEPDLSKYATYELVYAIENDNYYLESINRK